MEGKSLWLQIKVYSCQCKHTHTHIGALTLQVYNYLCATRELVSEMPKGNAVVCGFIILVGIHCVIGQLHKVSLHVGFYCHTVGYDIAFQNLSKRIGDL